MAPPTRIASPTLPEDLRELLQALRALPAQLVALQEQVADLNHQLSHLAEPASTTRSRVGVTSKATNSRRSSRGRTKSSQQRRPSKAQVLALVEYAGEGHYVVISPRGGLLPFEPESPAWFAWLDDLLVVSLCGEKWALDGASGTPQRLESRLACPSHHPQSHLQRPSGQD